MKCSERFEGLKREAPLAFVCSICCAFWSIARLQKDVLRCMLCLALFSIEKKRSIDADIQPKNAIFAKAFILRKDKTNNYNL